MSESVDGERRIETAEQQFARGVLALEEMRRIAKLLAELERPPLAGLAAQLGIHRCTLHRRIRAIRALGRRGR